MCICSFTHSSEQPFHLFAGMVFSVTVVEVPIGFVMNFGVEYFVAHDTIAVLRFSSNYRRLLSLLRLSTFQTPKGRSTADGRPAVERQSR